MGMLAASCEVEFSPNAEWKNIPSIYCVLDQDDSISYVRVERCYLSNDNLFSYGHNSDSINYPEGSITVAVLAYEGNHLADSIPFHYTLIDRDSGSFAHEQQPIYMSVTKGRLKDRFTYVLSVRNVADNSILAQSDPLSLVKQQYSNGRPIKLITKPDIKIRYDGDTLGEFDFTDKINGEFCCRIEWNTLENARLYQPIVRFFYEVEEDGRQVKKYVDVKCPQVTGRNTIDYSCNTFLSELKQKLQDDPRRKRYIPHVDIFLTCGSEELNAYMKSVSQASGSQDYTIFSNINGGTGIFAARRTKLYMGMPATYNPNPATGTTPGLYHLLTELGVGIY